MVDADLIVISAFISPFRSDREAARALFEPGEFIEVYVSAPPGNLRTTRPQGPLPESPPGPDQGLHRHRQPLRGPRRPGNHRQHRHRRPGRLRPQGAGVVVITDRQKYSFMPIMRSAETTVIEMARSLNQILKSEKPEVVNKATEKADAILLDIHLAEIRALVSRTQVDVAQALGVKQPTVAGMERSGKDLRLSSLKRYVEALGGKVSIDIELPDGQHRSFSL